MGLLAWGTRCSSPSCALGHAQRNASPSETCSSQYTVFRVPRGTAICQLSGSSGGALWLIRPGTVSFYVCRPPRPNTPPPPPGYRLYALYSHRPDHTDYKKPGSARVPCVPYLYGHGSPWRGENASTPFNKLRLSLHMKPLCPFRSRNLRALCYFNYLPVARSSTRGPPRPTWVCQGRACSPVPPAPPRAVVSAAPAAPAAPAALPPTSPVASAAAPPHRSRPAARQE